MSGGVLAGDAGWQDAEIACASLPDQRLARRLRRLLDQLSWGCRKDFCRRKFCFQRGGTSIR